MIVMARSPSCSAWWRSACFSCIRRKRNSSCSPRCGESWSALLPLVVVSPAELVGLYGSWWRLLSMDYAGSAGSVGHGVAAVVVSSRPAQDPSSTLIGIALFCWPLTVTVRALSRLQFPAAVSLQRAHLGGDLQSQGRVVHLRHRHVRRGLMVSVAADEAASTSCWCRLRSSLRVLSPTDVFPSSLSATLFVPYADQSRALHPDLGENHLRAQMAVRIR